MNKNCLICERIDLVKSKENPYFVKELKSGYVVIGDSQHFNGYTLLLNKKHVENMLDLSLLDRCLFLWDLLKVYKAVFKAFKPVRLNVELLGNIDHHLHWHIFPRYKNDKLPNKVVWLVNPEIRNKKAELSVINKNKGKLIKEL